MKLIKKSLNMSADLAQRIDDFIKENPGVSFTLIASQALESWINNPTINIHKPKNVSADELAVMIEDDKELMQDLAR